MIRRVHHTSFTVSDMERSLAFYRDLLGMEVIGDQGGKGGYLAEVVGCGTNLDQESFWMY